MNLALGFALLPSKEGTHYVCELNSAINSVYPSEFELQHEGNLLPHISMFQGQFPENVVRDVLKIAEDIYKKRKAIYTATTHGINVWATKIFFLDIVRDHYIQNMQEELFNALNPLRDQNAGSADPQDFKGITVAESNSFRKYGYPFALEAYRPHFTVGRSEKEDGNETKFAKQLEMNMPPPKTMTFNRFVVFRIGKYGRLESIVKEFNLISRKT